MKEWLDVAKFYMSDVPTDWLNGLQILASWHLRMPTDQPNVISLTLMIFKARLNDINMASDVITPQWIKDENYLFFNSMVIIRFINFLYETVQANFPRIITIQQAVSKMNIPDWIVQLRHASTHSDHMPNWRQCSDAVHYLDNWLKINYWSKNKFAAPNIEQEEQVEKNISMPENIPKTSTGCSLGALKWYKRYRGFSFPSPKSTDKRQMKCFRLMKIELTNDPTKFMKNLAKIMILSPKKLNYWQWNVFIDEIPPPLLREYWQKMFEFLKNQNRLIAFCEFLLTTKIYGSTEEEPISPLHCLQYRSWLLYLITFDYSVGNRSGSHWLRILNEFLKNQPCDTLDQRILSELKNKAFSSNEHYKGGKIWNFVSTLCQIEESFLRLNDQEINRLIGDTISTIPPQVATENFCDLAKINGWYRDERQSWQNVPLGLAPGSCVDDLVFSFVQHSF